MSKTLKIFLIVAGAAVGIAILLISTGVAQGLIENVIDWLNLEIKQAIPSIPDSPIPKPSW